ncbi:DUF885 domain-containing protein [Novosphingobium album (ex Hu et al. 2023)]|uniref:DUF885 domain-containing protein n=1 Tax=Novosphingobium album (ex Hu et al. 2023) TaxID=2930093 RepID=A0ABT0B053_9SPHN|nr:DUF885 domain-containing protein [Novosphingobium album (ex Hu et al. 2023)]MCJ2178169.1 DUF885 domain-containing protein [Novosphingobium album (ex Hu et al. 2023)]
MKAKLLAGLACLALGTSAVSASPASSSDNAVAQTSAWDSFVKNRIGEWLAIDPSFAIYEGAHEYDGKLPDWSTAGLKAKADFLHGLIADAAKFDGLTSDQAFERAYMVQVAKGQLFWLEDADQPHTNPEYYLNNGLDPNVYVSRSYADKPTRMKAMIAFLEAVPTAAAQIRANLKTPMPTSFIKLGTDAFEGFAGYYRGDARDAFADVDDAALQTQMKAASEKAGAAMQELADWLSKAPANEAYPLGAERFSRMLAATEAVDAPLDELEAVGRADLKRNRDALVAACAEYAPGKTVPECVARMSADKPADGPVAEARRQIPELAAFVREHHIVTIPGTRMAAVEESPPYNRANSAYMDPPGPLETNATSVYYISPPDPSWPTQKQLDYIPGKDDLLFTSVHEVMPGHYLQFLHSNQAPTIVGKLFVGYAFAEGWAHYAEQMMWDAGLGNGKPEVHIGQLSNALLRDCRFLSAIGLHARGMTQAQSKQMFMEQCYIDEGNAEQQAARGTYDPAYLNYTLGKLMILKLRQDWTATRGGREAWGAFHDQFLSYGGPAIPLVRQAMMHEDAPHAVF